MTVVVGVRGKKGVLLAGDSQSSTSWSKRERKDAKTCALSELVAVAYCGSYRLGQILTYHLEHLEDPPLGRDEHRWAVKEFIPKLRDVTHEHGLLRVQYNVDYLDNAAFLLAVRGRLFVVDVDFQVGEDVLPYGALGSGEDVAIGAMASRVGLDVTGPIADGRLDRIAAVGIEAATELTPYVGGSVTSVRTVLFTDEERALARSIVAARLLA